MSTWGTLVADAYTEIGALGAGETLSAEDLAWGLKKANRILDNWNAERAAVYADTFTTYVLTPSLDPHTIGPTGTWVVTQRPVSIEDAMLVYTSPTPDLLVPITIRDTQWWNALSMPAMTTALITDLYYDPTWPNGTLHFWPVCTTALSVRLHTRQYLSAIGTATTFTLPPGYQDALTLTLAEELAPSLNKELDARTVASAVQARARIFANNDDSLRIRTADSGLGGGSGAWNYLSRTWT